MLKILYLFFLIPLFISCQTETKVSNYPDHVGDIQFDVNLDDQNFKKCAEKDKGFQYYNDSNGLQYKGEKLAILNQFQKLNIRSSEKINGYITIRFVVNCEGKTGMFRIQQMNLIYQEDNLDGVFAKKILDFTKSLDGWIPKTINGDKTDYYQYLTYKIENGHVSEILP